MAQNAKRDSGFRPGIIIGLSLLFVLLACKKESKKEYGTLAGTGWQYNAYQLDIGNGDDSWHPAPSDHSRTLGFDKYGTGTVYDDGILSKAYRYQVTSDSTMTGRGDSVSQTWPAYFFISGDTLTISGRCIEACAVRYLRTYAL